MLAPQMLRARLQSAVRTPLGYWSVVAACALFALAFSSAALAAAEGPTVERSEAWVATAALERGALIADDDVATEARPTSDLAPSFATSSPVGRRVTSRIDKGEPVTEIRLSSAGGRSADFAVVALERSTPWPTTSPGAIIRLVVADPLDVEREPVIFDDVRVELADNSSVMVSLPIDDATRLSVLAAQRDVAAIEVG